MKKIIIATAAIAVLLCSCDQIFEDHRMDGLMDDMVYLPKAGFHTEGVYDVGSDVTVSLWAYKGSLKGTSCSVKYIVDANAVADYNVENGTQFAQLPEDCYTTSETTVSIKGKETHGKFSFTYYPDKIVAACGGKYDEEKFAIAFRIETDDVDVKEDMDCAIYSFIVKKPTIGVASGAEEPSLDITLTELEKVSGKAMFSMGFLNPSASQYEIETDTTVLKAAVDEYNTANGSSYSLLPAAAYQLSSVSGTIPEGANCLEIGYEVDPEKCSFGKFCLPVRLKSVTAPLVLGEEATCYIIVSCHYERTTLNRSGWSITASSYNTNVGNCDANKLIDGDMNTYWFVRGKDMGGQKRDVNPWWIVNLGKLTNVEQVVIDPRQATTEFIPGRIWTMKISTSMDSENWNVVTDLEYPFGNKDITKEAQVTMEMLAQKTFDVTVTQCKYVKIEFTYDMNKLTFAELNIVGTYLED